MLVNGVDISMLEGWMIKINSNPSFFGKNMNRRWFKVGFVPGPGSEKKLVISYSTSNDFFLKEMIEIVSPSRTLRLKDIRPSEHDVSDDSQEEDEDSPRPSTNSSTRSVLVAQIKSGSGLEDGMAQCKNVMSDSEEEDVNYENKQADPPEESPREPLTSSTDPIDDDFSHEKLEQMIPQRMNLTEPTKHKNSEYFDSDEEEQEQPPSKTNTRLSDNKTPVSNVTADNNFVHDDWDAEEEPTSQPTTKLHTRYEL
ncbi:hypothetical protein AM588_10002350 [Phytophthora nicotianae]|uniref:Uncharacterized protein n=1 Tax=Phytophthora nicotianae TaxID=4792 RepID=A0A0W8CRB7_PHYNI|nr:hypothetical protein AM588_10002350 [Phytophthora nicotianae]